MLRCVLFILSSMIAVASASSGCTPDDKSFDYMLLVEQWPGAYKGHAAGNYMTLHGMWPSRTGSGEKTYPCTCTTEKFDPTALSSISSELDEYWPSLMGMGNDEFHDHEWTKHGTCAGFSTELAFFSKTLQWRAQIDAFGALGKAGIAPGSSSFSATQIDAAFKSALGVTALLACGAGNSLQGVAFCINHDATKLIECDDSVKNGGGSIVSCDRSSPISFPSSGPPSPSPGPSPGPGPSPSPGAQCVHGQHGPPCSSDNDCTSIKDCVRCAHSGFCTDVPAGADEEAELMVIGNSSSSTAMLRGGFAAIQR